MNGTPRETSMDTFINEYNKGVFYFQSCDYLMQRLNINTVYPYFKAIDMAEKEDENGKPSIETILVRNMLSSSTRIAVKGIQEAMSTLNKHWDVMSNYGFVCSLEKEMDEASDHPHYPAGELDNYLTLITFNALFVSSLRLSLIFLDDIIKSIDNDNTPEFQRRYGDEKLNERLIRARAGYTELKDNWEIIHEASKSPSFQAFLDMKGFRRPLEESVNRLMNPIVGVLEKNDLINILTSEDKTPMKFFDSLLNIVEDIIFLMENYKKEIIED